MYWQLREGITLGLNKDHPFLMAEDGISFSVSEASFAVLAQLDGSKTLNEVALELSGLLGINLDDSLTYIYRVVTKYRRFLQNHELPQPRHIRIGQGQPKYEGPIGPPSVLHWVVTTDCCRNCIYCIRDATMSDAATDSLVSGERIRSILKRCAAVGTRRCYLDGGEPFLRKDIVDIIHVLTYYGYEITLITRYSICRDLAVRLKDNGLKRIGYSLDSADPEIADRLTGVTGFYSEAIQSISALVSAGIEVYLSAVVTRSTVKGLNALERTAASLGCDEIQFSVLSPASRGRIAWDEIPLQGDVAVYHQWLSSPDHAVRVFDGCEPFDGPRAARGCASGIENLIILPNGDVSLCDKLYDRTIVGNVIESDPLDVWYSERMAQLRFPPMEMFKGTDCYRCRKFDACNAHGRCYLSALVSNGNMYSPCRFCTEGKNSDCTAL